MNRNRFDALSISLHDLLEEIGSGKLQLPDFQRDWVWDDYRIRSLIASVSQSFPIGAVMTLETGHPDVCFKPRPIKGVDLTQIQKEPETLILDGQQRLTALFQSLMSKQGVYTLDTRGKEHYRYYYLDMEQCIKDEINREEAVLSCRKDLLRLQSTRGEIDLTPDAQEDLVTKEYDNAVFPIHRIFDANDWGDGYKKHWDDDPLKKNLFNQFDRKVIKCFESYDVPVIRLKKDTTREAVCLVFEKVNTRGVTLTVFELLTATFAASDFLLREDWEKRDARLKESPVLEDVDSTHFLRALTLLATNSNPNTPISCTRREILRLPVSDYKKLAGQVEAGFKEAARFLHSQKIFNARDLPYPTQLVPLTAIFADLDGEIEPSMKAKIVQWYWCGVFGEMYGASTDTRFANDFSEVTAWVKGEPDVPRTIREANFQENRLLELRTRNSAAYKGIFALLMHNDGCRDFRTGETIELQRFFNDNIDIHHIFPKRWCEKENIDKDIYNSIINKTALSSHTNRMIGGKPPSEYLKNFEQHPQVELPLISETNSLDMDEIFKSHLICPSALRADDFERFFEARKEALLEAIGNKIGNNKVIREGDEPPDTSA